MESELAELRWHAENGTQGLDGGPRRASAPPQLAAVDAVPSDQHAMSEDAQVERMGEMKRGGREVEGTSSMQRAEGYRMDSCVQSRPLMYRYRYRYQNFEGGCDADPGA